jgi:hypothetical protein
MEVGTDPLRSIWMLSFRFNPRGNVFASEFVIVNRLEASDLNRPDHVKFDVDSMC